MTMIQTTDSRMATPNERAQALISAASFVTPPRPIYAEGHSREGQPFDDFDFATYLRDSYMKSKPQTFSSLRDNSVKDHWVTLGSAQEPDLNGNT